MLKKITLPTLALSTVLLTGCISPLAVTNPYDYEPVVDEPEETQGNTTIILPQAQRSQGITQLYIAYDSIGQIQALSALDGKEISLSKVVIQQGDTLVELDTKSADAEVQAAINPDAVINRVIPGSTTDVILNSSNVPTVNAPQPVVVTSSVEE